MCIWDIEWTWRKKAFVRVEAFDERRMTTYLSVLARIFHNERAVGNNNMYLRKKNFDYYDTRKLCFFV